MANKMKEEIKKQIKDEAEKYINAEIDFIEGATFGYNLKEEINGDVIERFMTWIDNFATWNGNDWGVVNVSERFTHKTLFNFYKDQI